MLPTILLSFPSLGPIIHAVLRDEGALPPDVRNPCWTDKPDINFNGHGNGHRPARSGGFASAGGFGALGDVATARMTDVAGCGMRNRDVENDGDGRDADGRWVGRYIAVEELLMPEESVASLVTGRPGGSRGYFEPCEARRNLSSGKS